MDLTSTRPNWIALFADLSDLYSNPINAALQQKASEEDKPRNGYTNQERFNP